MTQKSLMFRSEARLAWANSLALASAAHACDPVTEPDCSQRNPHRTTLIFARMVQQT
jgi:hypothetical protein